MCIRDSCADFGLEFPSGLCDGGWYCVSNSPISNPDNSTHGGECKPGFFCPEGSVSPIPCLAGHYCNDFRLSQVSGACHPGYYCTGRAISSRPKDTETGDVCPCGHYCPEGSPFPEPCPDGYYSNTTGSRDITSCRPCDKGSFCSLQGLCEINGLCSAGYYCPEGQSSPRPSDFLCPPGHYCPLGSSRPIACDPGYFQDAFGKSICKSCPKGYFCDGNPTSGISGTSVPKPCLPGQYCPLETRYVNEYLCPVGTYSNIMLLANISQCTSCMPGHYCDSEGLTAPAGLCDSGYYCISGAATSQPEDDLTGNICPPGTYCPEGASHPTLCPLGTLNPLKGGLDYSYCIDCTPGNFCDKLGAHNTSGLCYPGFYCSGGASNPMPLDITTGYFCPKGYRCPEGSSTPLPCVGGEYSNVTHSSTCSVCPAGFYCPGNATVIPLSCPVGHFCEEGTSVPKFCPIGTFNPYTNVSSSLECLKCTAGYYCDSIGLESASGQCDAGYFCPLGVSTNAPPDNICPPGFYCPVGSGYPLECPSGTFSNSYGLESYSECELCPSGLYCEGTGRQSPSGVCAAGYFCTRGSDSARPINGTLEYGPCPIGHFCPPASTIPIPCSEGTYNPLMKQEICLPCLMGFYCPTGTSDYLQYPCFPGHYCPPGTKYGSQYPCPIGSYNPYEGTTAQTACLICPPGEFCGAEGLSSPSGPCSGGYFCTRNSSIPNPSLLEDDIANTSSGGICPLGTFCPIMSTFPMSCTPGYFCNVLGLSSVSGKCYPGPVSYTHLTLPTIYSV